MSRYSKIVNLLAVALMAVGLASAEGRPAASSVDDAGFDRGIVSELHGGNSGPCGRHAKLMRRACMADRKDDLLVHWADCVYVTAPEDSSDCFADAREEAEEKAEECEEVYEARIDLCELVGPQRYDVEFDPDDFVDPDEIGDEVDPNPYWPLTEGHTHVIVGEGEVTVVTVTDEVIDVGGLPCRVVRDLAFEEVVEDGEPTEYEAIEVTQDWYAQNEDGDTIYCGENTYEIEDGLIDNTDGSFANGTDRALAGFLVRAFPAPGQGDRQEMASDEAEDYVRYESLAASPDDDDMAYPCDGGCLQTYEVNPRDPGEAEYKYYLPGTGFVLAVKLDENDELTGEREEVTCIGDSIEVLGVGDGELCGIDDPDALFEALCAWAPEALCFDED